MNNCTLTGNSASTLGSVYEASTGAAAFSVLKNCIGFGNRIFAQGLQFPFGYHWYCEDCASPGHLAGNNWRGDPSFVDTNAWADLRLQSNSPCINAGNNSYVTSATDLDGNRRIVGGRVDIG